MMEVVQPAKDFIRLRGVRVNNLKNIQVQVPIHRLTVVTGVSGSGKSSLAFDTLYAEGQRRYVESMSAYARQFLERLHKPDADEIQGICPAIAIRQKSITRNPRSTVGTVTEIFDFLRLLYSRIGVTRCRECGREIRKDQPEEIAVDLLKLPIGTRLYLLFPLRDLLGAKDPPQAIDPAPKSSRRTSAASALKLDGSLAERLRKEGFARLFIRREIVDLNDIAHFKERRIDADCYVLVDRIVLQDDSRQRLVDSLETCFREGDGHAAVYLLPSDSPELGLRLRDIWPHHRPAPPPGDLLKFSENFECQDCGIAYERPEPRLFSFNNPFGACPTCQGFGNTVTIDLDQVIPDTTKSLAEGAIEPWTKPSYRAFQQRLKDYCRSAGISMSEPFGSLSAEDRDRIIRGSDGFPGIHGFFDYLEGKKYKMHVRIFISRYRGYAPCRDCGARRLRPEALDVFVTDKRISEVAAMSIREAQLFFQNLTLKPSQEEIATRILSEIRHRLDLLMRVGLDYLHLDRLSSTLSGGESQRIQLSSALGSALVGALYVLDEPSIGLHARDGERLIQILRNLRDIGNTVLVVEHDPQIIRAADYLIDLGPGAGERGGQVVFEGPLKNLAACAHSLTARHLTGELRIPTPVFRRAGNGRSLRFEGVTAHNLKNLTLRIPLDMMVCLTGVSGSGKSTLAHEVVFAGLKKAQGDWNEPVGPFRSLRGAEQLADVVLVDQSPIGRTPRSNPITYMKAFDEIRALFASSREAMSLGLGPGHFSFNIPGGRCERCQGSGVETVSMQFLADVELQCEECRGTRYQASVLEIRFKAKNIHDVLQMTVSEALAFFAGVPRVLKRLKVLDEVGLGYLQLGQSATTLSGGEAQRLKLCSYLADQQASRVLYIFDEPTTGLHLDDIAKLLRAFDRLLSAGASLLIIEHHLDVLKTADWIIDLGPEGGDQGGYLVCEGTPEQICRSPRSHTGRFLRPLLPAA